MTGTVEVAPRTRDRAALPRTIAVLATGLLAGAVLAVWLVQEALGGSAELYIGFRQATDPAFTRVLPPLGVGGLVAAVVALGLGWSQHPTSKHLTRWLTLAAVGCLGLGLAITVVVHLPINADLLTWSASAPPSDWGDVRDRWVAAHQVRTVLSISGFVLLLGAANAAGRCGGR